ncbi:putative SP-containing protein [Vairimorpha necatrix]|uniref:SP-containing protein n=1 Tax=Vairimorpha necatrix TaxID=6039 RepID=A0AAX4JF59_9MICR
MFILHVFYMFVSIQAIYRPLCNKTTKGVNQKIEGGDYRMVDTTKNYGYADLRHFENKILSFSFKILDFEKNKNSEIPESLNINCEGKSLDIILNEYERKLIEIMNKYNLYKVFLVYRDAVTDECINYNENIIIKDIIEGIRKINDDRNNTNNENKFLHQKTIQAYINEEKSMIHMIEVAPLKTEYYRCRANSYVEYKKELSGDICISVLVYIEKAYFYFEFSKVEMLDIVKQCLKEKNKISPKCFDLYEDVFFSSSYSNKSVRFFTERSLKIPNTTRQNENCKIIKLLRDELGLLKCPQNNNTTINPVQENNLEGRKYAEKMQDLMGNTEYEVIDAFNILLKENEIGFLVKRILDKTKDQLNIFFGHILVFDELIETEDLDCLIENKGNLNREEIISKIFSSNKYRYRCVKIFLFVEAGNYINNEKAAEGSFKTLKEIGNIMKDNLRNEDQNEQSSKYLNLVDIMNEVIVKQSENFEVFRILNMTNFIQLLVNSSFNEDTFITYKKVEYLQMNS